MEAGRRARRGLVAIVGHDGEVVQAQVECGRQVDRVERAYGRLERLTRPGADGWRVGHEVSARDAGRTPGRSRTRWRSRAPFASAVPWARTRAPRSASLRT